jgi:Ca2+-binding EF-hand superfamily protein
VTAEELTQRVAVLKRFRELLQAQRDRFREYLNVLDKQQGLIERGDTEALLAHVELEEHILRDIFNIQKVILPLEDLYHTLTDQGSSADEETVSLKAALEGLRREAAARSERNRELLSGRMAEIRQEIKSLRGNPYAARRSIYADTLSPSLIDIQG